MAVVKDPKADLQNWGQVGVTARPPRRPSISYSGREATLPRGHSHSLLRARESSYQLWTSLSAKQAAPRWTRDTGQETRREEGISLKETGSSMLPYGYGKSPPPCISLNNILEKK